MSGSSSTTRTRSDGDLFTVWGIFLVYTESRWQDRGERPQTLRDPSLTFQGGGQDGRLAVAVRAQGGASGKEITTVVPPVGGQST